MDTGPPLHPAAGNGTAVPPNGNTGPMSEAHIVQALNVIFDTASSNEARAEATKFLDEAKQLDQAPLAGFQLALDAAHTAALRHYGLSMLEHAVKYRWEDYNPEQIGALRGYTVQLAHNLTEHDPAFLRNKVAQLWTEIAKRSWAKEWMDMDRQLVELWESSMHHREVVLYVLETLTEEVFNREDITADLRGGDLGRACVEIFAPSYSPDAQSETREGSTKGSDIRYGKEGWLQRLCDCLSWCLSQGSERDERARASTVKVLHTLRAAMSWTLPLAMAKVHIVDHACAALAVPVVSIQQVHKRPCNLTATDSLGCLRRSV